MKSPAEHSIPQSIRRCKVIHSGIRQSITTAEQLLQLRMTTVYQKCLMGMEQVLMGTHQINISLLYHISTKMVPVCEPPWEPACISTDLRAIYWCNRLPYYIRLTTKKTWSLWILQFLRSYCDYMINKMHIYIILHLIIFKSLYLMIKIIIFNDYV